LSPEELAKREKVRAAARERQRKHRALIKAKKMRELGLDMGNDIQPGMDEYQAAAYHHHHHQHHPHHPPHPPPGTLHGEGHSSHGAPSQAPSGQHQEPPFPPGRPLGGQTFASTLLLSFSCAPVLKAHIMRTLHMTNEELASLEPVIAQAWDHWDHEVWLFLFI
jgi:hypothetical protein